MQIDLSHVLADGFVTMLRQFVTAYKLHPILVNFTAALVPTSVAADILARLLKKESLRATAWWTLFLAACITPLTALAGWLFWMDDDMGVAAMTIHKWLGTSLAVLLIGLVLWRWLLFRKKQWASAAYIFAGIVIVGALIYQGHLGGGQSFDAMTSEAATIPNTPTTGAHGESSSEPGSMKGMPMPVPEGLPVAPVNHDVKKGN